MKFKEQKGLITAAKMEQPLNIPSLSIDEDEFLPNTHSSLLNPLESPTSKESPMMSHNTVGNRERTKAATEVVEDNPKVNVYSAAKVSLQCKRCLSRRQSSSRGRLGDAFPPTTTTTIL